MLDANAVDDVAFMLNLWSTMLSTSKTSKFAAVKVTDTTANIELQKKILTLLSYFTSFFLPISLYASFSFSCNFYTTSVIALET